MFEVSTDGKRVNWIKIKVLKVDKGAENTIQYKYNYDHDIFMKINVEKNGRRGKRHNVQWIIPGQKYMDKPTISIEKKAV